MTHQSAIFLNSKGKFHHLGSMLISGNIQSFERELTRLNTRKLNSYQELTLNLYNLRKLRIRNEQTAFMQILYNSLNHEKLNSFSVLKGYFLLALSNFKADEVKEQEKIETFF